MSLYHDWRVKIQENDKQWEAFQKAGHTVVIAGPGSGKTRVLAVKIAKLLRDDISPPRGIACLTYTRMMAKELETRLNSLGVLDRPNVVVGTVHSFCLAHIVQPFAEVFELDIPKPIKIAPTKVWDSCLDKARREVINKGFDPNNSADKKFKTEITKYNLQRTDIPLYQWENQEYAKILNLHYQFLCDEGYVDFDFIVKLALNLIIGQDLVRQSLYSKFAWLAVDEYQDLGYPLFRIVTEMLSHTDIKLFVIGDPDQCIYDFVGTDPKYLIELAESPAIQPAIKLSKNYRETSEIITIAKAILTPHCDYESNKNGGGCRVYETPPNEQNKKVSLIIKKYLEYGYSSNNIAVLHPWREGSEGREGINAIARELLNSNIEFTLDKNPHYDRSLTLIKWLEDLGHFCLVDFGLQNSSAESKTFDELVKTWSWIIQPQALGDQIDSKLRLQLVKLIWSVRGKNMRLGEWLSYVRNKLNFNLTLQEYKKIFPDDIEEFNHLYQIAQQNGELSGRYLRDFVCLNTGVQLTTLHSSKGMEFQVVIIAGIERIWDDENGKRLLYVGVTRAEREVCLVYSKIWPTWSPQTPKYINSLIEKCNHFSYFSHHSLQ
jgi:DNA helicase II / ATP-dependent DNA helicase PcrA